MNLQSSTLVVLSVLTIRMWPVLGQFSLVLKLVHFGFVSIFAILASFGLEFSLVAFFRPSKFVHLLSFPNPFALRPTFFLIIGIIFSTIGVILFWATLRLGACKKWGRRAFLFLAVPYSMMLPSFMATANDHCQRLGANNEVIIETTILVIVSVAAIVTYHLKCFLKLFSLN